MYMIRDENGKILSISEIYESGYPTLAMRQEKDKRMAFKKDIISDLAKTCKNAKNTPIIPTGFRVLDEKLDGGLRPGLYVFGSNPGIGKTSFLTHMTIKLAMNKVPVIYFNLDMSEQQMSSKLLSCLSYGCFQGNGDASWKMKPSEINKELKNATPKDNTPITNIARCYFCEFHPYITLLSSNNNEKINDITSVMYSIKHSKEILEVTPVIIIDFLQQMTEYFDPDEEQKQYSDKRFEVNSILKQLKQFSSKYQVPILIVTSVNRSNYTKEESNDEEISYSMGFGKESGDIEYLADFLCLMTRGKKDLVFGSDDHEIVKFNILKSRFSKSNDVLSFEFLPKYSFYKTIEEK